MRRKIMQWIRGRTPTRWMNEIKRIADFKSGFFSYHYKRPLSNVQWCTSIGWDEKFGPYGDRTGSLPYPLLFQILLFICIWESRTRDVKWYTASRLHCVHHPETFQYTVPFKPKHNNTLLPHYRITDTAVISIKYCISITPHNFFLIFQSSYTTFKAYADVCIV